MTSSFEKILYLGSNYLYIARTNSLGGENINYAGRWDGSANAHEAIDDGVGSFSVAICSVPNTDNVYVSGSFVQAGGSVTVNKIAYYNGTSWDDLNGATLFTNNVTSLAYDNLHGILYAGSHQTSTTTNRIGKWNGTSWTGIAEATVNTYTKMSVDADGNLYLGYGSTLKRYLYASSTWETLSSSIGGTISDVKYNKVDNRVYVALYISSGASIKYYDITGDSIGALSDLGGYPRAVAFDSNNDIFVACQSPSTYQECVVKHTGGGWTNLYNHRSTSGVLEIEIDANDNIFCYGNSASLVLGVSPYGVGDWEDFSATTAISYGGPRDIISSEGMGFELEDAVCLSSNNSQHGTIYRMHPLGIQNAFVVKWSVGPVFSQNKKTAYFGNSVDDIEHIV